MKKIQDNVFTFLLVLLTSVGLFGATPMNAQASEWPTVTAEVQGDGMNVDSVIKVKVSRVVPEEFIWLGWAICEEESALWCKALSRQLYHIRKTQETFKFEYGRPISFIPSEDEILIYPSKSGQQSFTITGVYTTKQTQTPYNTNSIVISTNVSGVGNLDVNELPPGQIDNKLSLNCPSKLSGISVSCSAVAETRWFGIPLKGDIELKYCSLISSRAIQNCDSGPSKSATLPQEVKTVTMPLGSQRNISLRNTSTSEFLFVLWDPNSGESAVRSWAKQPTFKTLRVDLKIPQEVQFGMTYSYSLKTTPALTGTCALWRFREGQPYKVASPVLKSGKASGRLTWLWTPTSNPTPMTLTAVCSSGKYKGEDIELTQGYKQ
jgi:hypothetical protein